MKARRIFRQLAALGALVVLLKIAMRSEPGAAFSGFIDVEAAIIVFICPWLLLMITDTLPQSLRQVWGRYRQFKNYSNDQMSAEFRDQVLIQSPQTRTSRCLDWMERAPDSNLNSAARLVAAKYSPEQITEVLNERSEVEVSQALRLSQTLGFLAKTAPYFGMLATVVGMVGLLEHLQDFSQIGGSLATAMLGTMYGLMSFVVIYSPLQKAARDYAENLMERNQNIVRWVNQSLKKTETQLVQEQNVQWEKMGRPQDLPAEKGNQKWGHA